MNFSQSGLLMFMFLLQCYLLGITFRATTPRVNARRRGVTFTALPDMKGKRPITIEENTGCNSELIKETKFE